MAIYYESELYHHGIKGQKWGVRRYQNYDGTLTTAGKKRISKEYTKLNERGMRRWAGKQTREYVNAHNRAAGEFDVNKFNSDYEKKHGRDSFGSQEYYDTYNKAFNKLVSRHFDESLRNFMDNDPDINAGRELCAAFDMVSWNQIARDNEDAIRELRKRLG